MRALRLLLWPAGAALGIAAEAVAFDWREPADWVPDLATGWTLIACGLVGWARRPDSRSGSLMVATGIAWFTANFANDQLLYLHRGPLIHLVLAYPAGRLSGRLDRLTVGIAYIAALVPAIWDSEAATFLLAGLILLAAAVGHSRAVGRERRTRWAALQATSFVAAVLAGTAAVRLAVATPEGQQGTLLFYEAALCTLAVGLLVGLLREPWARSRVADLVVELGDARPGTLRDALARAVGDPGLEIGYRLGDGYVDSQGHPLTIPMAPRERTVTPVERDGQVIAVLVHNPAVLDDSSLSDALAGAARLAAVNARLQAEVVNQLAELQASRRRLVRAGDAERRRLERRLRDTVEPRLQELDRTLAVAAADTAGPERLQPVAEQLALALQELHELAAGIHPGGGGSGALAGALESLAARSPVPVELSVPDDRLREEVATAVYFVCSEALANVAKHADASQVTISVAAGDARMRVEVHDDGVGGADAATGTGLRGLADRAEALGGTLVVESPPGRGTRLIAELPLGEVET